MITALEILGMLLALVVLAAAGLGVLYVGIRVLDEVQEARARRALYKPRPK